jgi:putative ABC transport system ATP-binding protein
MDENQLALFRRKTVGFIFQSFNLVQSMNAQENVAFPMQFAGVPARQRDARALELLERVGLADRSQHKPNELSGGQQQRVAIARSLVNEPALVLADEPTGNLDTTSGGSVMQVLSELHQSGRTVLVVTHDPRMAHFASHRIFILDGKIVSENEYRSASLE